MDGEVLLREYDQSHEAELAAAYLREHGISARVQENLLSNMNPLWGMVVGGTRIFVRESENKTARRLLGELIALRRLDELEQERTNPDERARTQGDDAARRALVAAVVGAFLLPVVTQLYSLWLAGELDPRILSQRGRRHRKIAIVVDAIVLVAALGFVVLEDQLPLP